MPYISRNQNRQKDVILETKRNVHVRFQNELSAFKSMCKEVIAMSFEDGKIWFENFEK